MLADVVGRRVKVGQAVEPIVNVGQQTEVAMSGVGPPRTVSRIGWLAPEE